MSLLRSEVSAVPLPSTPCYSIGQITRDVTHPNSTGYVCLVSYYAVPLWLLQVGVPLMVLWSYYYRNYRACSSCRLSPQILKRFVATTIWRSMVPKWQVRLGYRLCTSLFNHPKESDYHPVLQKVPQELVCKTVLKCSVSLVTSAPFSSSRGWDCASLLYICNWYGSVKEALKKKTLLTISTGYASIFLSSIQLMFVRMSDNHFFETHQNKVNF